MDVLETDRLVLRRLSPEDAEFILELVNDPDWLRFIGDRGVRSLEDAREYIRSGPMDMYDRFGFGLFAVERKARDGPIGICGLLKREWLENVDLGFAFLPAFRRRGYAREAAAGTLAYAREVLGLARVAAITSPDNEASQNLLRQLGFGFDRMVRPPANDARLALFLSERAGGATRDDR